MKNPKTTISGYMVLLASIISFAASLLQGTPDVGMIQNVITAIAGAGLIVSGDGKH